MIYNARQNRVLHLLIPLSLLALLAGCQAPVSGVYNPRDFGARGDGLTLDTAAVNQAIDAAATNGGGTVHFTAGTYLCYSIHLKSNITLNLDTGATIMAAESKIGEGYYDAPEPNESNHYQDFGHTHWHNSLIWGENLHDVSITGHGLIWGKGLSRGGLPSTQPTTKKSTTRKSSTRRSTTRRSSTRRSKKRKGKNDSGETRPSGEGSDGEGSNLAGNGPTTEPSKGDELPWEDQDDVVVDVPPGDPANLDSDDYTTVTRPSTKPATEPTTAPATQPLFQYPNDKDTLPTGIGNKSISLKNCHGVIIRDVSILAGGHFAILATAVDNLTIDNVKLDTNRDGMDIDSCRNVRVSNCFVNSPADDGICLKTSYGLGTTRPTENVTITNCYVSGGYEVGSMLDGTYKLFESVYDNPKARHVARTGRIKLGTESNGDYKNITISNCVFDKCNGLAIESVDGSIIENLTITNISMRDITAVPIFIRLGERLRGPKELTTVGAIRHVNISNVICTNAAAHYACVISGTPGHPIEDVSLSNIKLYFPGGGTPAMASTRPIEKENAYPEPTMFGTLPAWGFYIRHLNLLQMDHVNLTAAKPDQRPPFMLIDVKEAEFDHVRTNIAPNSPNFILYDVGHIITDHFQGVPNTDRAPATQESF